MKWHAAGHVKLKHSQVALLSFTYLSQNVMGNGISKKWGDLKLTVYQMESLENVQGLVDIWKVPQTYQGNSVRWTIRLNSCTHKDSFSKSGHDLS